MTTRDEVVAELRRVIEDHLGEEEDEGVRATIAIDLMETTGKLLLPLCHVRVDAASINRAIG